MSLLKKRQAWLLLLTFICIAAALTSCTSYSKLPYYQDLDKTKVTEQDIANYTQLTVQPADILGINVSSSNPEASAVFNYNLNTINGTPVNNTNSPVLGYQVNAAGEIVLPIIGKLEVSGLTITQVETLTQTKLSPYLKACIVNIRLINLKVSVLGDVEHPGVFQVQTGRINVNDAIGLAGDLNITAIRKIMLIREIDGKRRFIPIDLTSKDLFQSPYYYLNNNDIIYVQPGRNKFASVDSNYRTVTIILSALSIIAIILTR